MTTDMNDNDQRVSAAYRKLAREKAPPALDDRILSMAATHGRSRFGWNQAWNRPLAWAATIGLSFAFVLEISQYTNAPATEADTVEPGAPEERPLTDEVAKGNNDARQEERKRFDKPAMSQKITPALTTSPQAAAQENDAVIADVEANEPVLLRVTEQEIQGRAAPAGAATEFAEKKELTDHCPDATREAADTWYTCIVMLREDGLTDAANEELKALLAAFPDFQESTENK